ncbi:MAG: methyltransferase domain-containing protein [Patescibacteria group bacterium]|nr:methyltransferase domain-containing protein [bacterium]MDZ4240950.1 methyltransferase domain-containing protein [Patescibacteria group bacterium]
MKENTSWGNVADWYDTHLEQGGDTYQRKVILPNLLRVLDLKAGESVLDLACGQGFFSREFANAGAKVIGTDISKELIGYAQEHSPKEITFHVSPADNLSFAKDAEFDVVTIILAIQNIENISGVFSEVKRVLSPQGGLIMVLNHPAFRIPKQSEWGWDEEKQIQYRRIDRYLSPQKISIEMHPGEEKGEQTISYHRSLQDFFKALSKNGFAISKLEEWISHRESQEGPRQKAEDTARKEIPLFLMLEAKKM